MEQNIFDKLRLIVNDQSKVSQYTHTFYRYPARFSPLFARTIIDLFSDPHDIVFDPFMGGGTTLVEAIVQGRKVWGNDISSLANFITKVKTTPLMPQEIKEVECWALATIAALRITNCRYYTCNSDHWNLQHLPWRMERAIRNIIIEIDRLPNAKMQRFARACLLKTSQWALDCNRKHPSLAQFKSKFKQDVYELLNGISEYSHTYKMKFGSYRNINQFRLLTKASTENIDYTLPHFDDKPKLILTSPPYPGVHVVYHRWQILGRRETDAPFWITNTLDGKSGSYYTFGWHRQPELFSYFQIASSSFSAIRNIIDPEAIVVQLVGFNDRKKYFPRYLKMMEMAGFEEIGFTKSFSRKTRIWRTVPNRKWYADAKGTLQSSKEVLLIHKVKN